MPAFGPISRRGLIRHLRQLGFDGPYSGGKHEFVIRGNVTLHVPNPHDESLACNRSTSTNTRQTAAASIAVPPISRV